MDNFRREMSHAVRRGTLPTSCANQRRRYLVCRQIDSKARHAHSHQENAEKSLISKSIPVGARQLQRSEKHRVADLTTGEISKLSLEFRSRKLSESFARWLNHGIS
jgi:histidyl-tRNA synthetase